MTLNNAIIDMMLFNAYRDYCHLKGIKRKEFCIRDFVEKVAIDILTLANEIEHNVKEVTGHSKIFIGKLLGGSNRIQRFCQWCLLDGVKRRIRSACQCGLILCDECYIKHVNELE